MLKLKVANTKEITREIRIDGWLTALERKQGLD